jgi:hypothetical protein
MKALREKFEKILQEIIIDEDNGEQNVAYFKQDYLHRLINAVEEYFKQTGKQGGETTKK